MSVTQKCVCHMPEAWSIEYLKTQWLELEKTANISFFQSWYWIDAWLSVAKKYVRPVFIKAEGRIIGIFFLGTGTTYDHRFLSFSTVIPWNTGIEEIDVSASEYNRPIALTGYEQQARQAVTEFLFTDKRFDKNMRVDLRRVPENEYQDYLKQDLIKDIYKIEDGATVDLEEIRSKDSLEHLISNNAYSQIKRSIRLYEENFGELIYEVAENATKAQNWFVELGKLNHKRFREKKQKGVWDYPSLLQMHRALLDRCFEKGCTEVVRVRAGDKIIGYLYNFIFRGRVYFYMGGFVYEEDNKFKPGMVTHYYAILAAARNGHDIYDFMAGNQPYKKRFGKDGQKMMHLTLTRPCFKQKISDKLSSLRTVIGHKSKLEVLEDNKNDELEEK